MAAPNEVQIGPEFDEFPGRSFNELVKGWYQWQAERAARVQKGVATGGFLPILARNVTGSALEYGNCVAIEGLATAFASKADQQYNRPLAKAQKHTAALHHALMGVAVTRVDIDAVGSFIITGPAWIKANFTDDGHHFAKIDENQSTFSPLAISASSGYPIIDSEEVPDPEYLPIELWALVLLGSGGGSATSNLRDARVTTEIPAAGSNLEVDWGITGEVDVTDESSGELSGSSIPVTNTLRSGFIVDCQVEIDMAYNPPRVRNGTCDPVNWEEAET